jgi:hypothetical protein
MQGYGLGGSNATCVELGPKQGGLTLACRECAQSGYQPFARGNAVEFWLKDQNGSSAIPDLQVRAWLYATVCAACCPCTRAEAIRYPAGLLVGACMHTCVQCCGTWQPPLLRLSSRRWHETPACLELAHEVRLRNACGPGHSGGSNETHS